jgi:hypothetical protein
MLDFFL